MPKKTTEDRVERLLIPLDYTFDRDAQINRGKAYVDVPVWYEPDLAVRGDNLMVYNN